MSNHLPPVTVAARLMGGIEALARVVGHQGKSGYGWRHPTMNHDAGDFRSARHMRAVLRAAQAQGIPLTPVHLLFGASEAEMAALEARMPPIVEAAE